MNYRLEQYKYIRAEELSYTSCFHPDTTVRLLSRYLIDKLYNQDPKLVAPATFKRLSEAMSREANQEQS
tara:strand:+ start:278 stop:484 length:207 start_codon:yes stop_codon:yes gene_type:complete